VRRCARARRVVPSVRRTPHPSRILSAALYTGSFPGRPSAGSVRKWRNWQTRKPQELVPAREWRFESSLPHQNSSGTTGATSTTGDRNLSRVHLLWGGRRVPQGESDAFIAGSPPSSTPPKPNALRVVAPVAPRKNQCGPERQSPVARRTRRSCRTRVLLNCRHRHLGPHGLARDLIDAQTE
jgi:hypothetical protein